MVWSVEVFTHRRRHPKKTDTLHRQKAKHRNRKKRAVCANEICKRRFHAVTVKSFPDSVNDLDAYEAYYEIQCCIKDTALWRERDNRGEIMSQIINAFFLTRKYLAVIPLGGVETG